MRCCSRHTHIKMLKRGGYGIEKDPYINQPSDKVWWLCWWASLIGSIILLVTLSMLIT